MNFWVRVYDIFFGMRDKDIIMLIMVRVGNLVEYIFGFGWELLIRFKVVLDIEKIFCRGLKMIRDGGVIKWI